MNLRDISIIITSYNEASNIRRCLESAQGFGETVLIDSFSSDATLDIAREFPVTIYQRPYRSAAAQKNWGLELVKNRWVLVLDADEALTEPLRREIEGLEADGGMDGYWIRRSSEYLGTLIRGCGWQRDKVLRLFLSERGCYEEKLVHEEVALEGRVGLLQNPLLHRPYRDVQHHFQKINEYSSRGARDYVNRGGRWALLNMIVHPPLRFLRMFVLQRGFIDRSRGLILCLLSTYSVFLKYAKAWEYGLWKNHG